MPNTAEGKQTRLFIGAMKKQYQRTPQSRFKRFEDTDAFKQLLNLSPEESHTAYEQMVTPPEREPTDPKLIEVTDVLQRMDDLDISAPQAAPVQRPGLTVCPIDTERKRHEAGGPRRRMEAMNRLSNGVASDEDKELLNMDAETEHDQEAESA